MKRIATTAVVLTFLLTGMVHAQEVSGLDSDSDGIPDHVELRVYHTNPLSQDTDADGFFDSDEITNGFSPLLKNQQRLRDVDTDQDGLPDDWEIAIGTDLAN